MKQIPFPRHADNAQRILIFTPEQIVPAAMMFVIGLVTETLAFSVAIGIGLSWAFMKYSEGKPDGFLLHAAYWYGLFPLKARSAINPFLRRIDPL